MIGIDANAKTRQIGEIFFRGLPSFIPLEEDSCLLEMRPQCQVLLESDKAGT
jgi:hypothetical protein